MLGRCSNKREISSTEKLIYSVTFCKDERPECNSRLSAIVSALDKIQLTPKFRGGSEINELQNSNTATFENKDIADKQSGAYISPLKKARYPVSEEGADVSGDTHTTDTTFNEPLVSAGAGICLVDYVAKAAKVTKNPPIGFALVCPHGHHAVPDGPLEFCSVGNVATAARHAQLAHGLQRVFIIDFSASPGKGTSEVFYDDPDVFFLSSHQDGILPGAGEIEDKGRGKGVGGTLNLPLPPFSGYYAMQKVFHRVIVPCIQRFKPDIILVSAGYDGHVQDPRSKLQFNTATYSMLASGIKKLAKELCGGRCVFFLEGGYDLESLSNSVAECFRAFIEEPSNSAKYDCPHFYIMEPFLGVNKAIQKIKQLHSLENPNSA